MNIPTETLLGDYDDYDIYSPSEPRDIADDWRAFDLRIDTLIDRLIDRHRAQGRADANSARRSLGQRARYSQSPRKAPIKKSDQGAPHNE